MIDFKSINADQHNGMKYELMVSHERFCPRFKGYSATHQWARLELDGYLRVKAGYRWDGATGAVDTADFMEASMYHDVLCEMINNGDIPSKKWNDAAATMRDINKEQGMGLLRRMWTWAAVRLYGRTK